MKGHADETTGGTGERAYTVIIPSKDRVAMLQEALDSVFAQSLPPTSVQLVVDEPADHEKYAFLSRYDSRLELHFTGGGFGGARARNIGLERTKTAYVFFLDDDDLWLAEKAERQIQSLEEHPEWTGVTCWRLEEGHDVRLEPRVSPWKLRTFCRAENVVGSLSQFAMRVNDRTRSLRLEPALRSSQDQEFYLQVCEVGTIGLVCEILVRYRLHRGARITGSDLNKFVTLETVYRKHRGSLSWREDFYWRARLASWATLTSGTALQRSRQFLRVLFNLFLSGTLIVGAGPTLRRAGAGLIRWNAEG